MKRSYMLKVFASINDGEKSKTVFNPDFEPGLLAQQEVVFDLTEAEYASPGFAAHLLTLESDLTDDCFIATHEYSEEE